MHKHILRHSEVLPCESKPNQGDSAQQTIYRSENVLRLKNIILKSEIQTQ